MLRIWALTQEDRLVKNLSLQDIASQNFKWYWVDFDQPDEAEIGLLSSHFQFHPLAIEDCLHFIQRPKLDYYDQVTFFVFHSLDPKTMEVKEVDCFLGDGFIVTFHLEPLDYINRVYEKLEKARDKSPMFIFHAMVDEAVDLYFPIMYSMEDRLNEIEDNTRGLSTADLMEEVFDIRSELLRLRRTIYPMRDLIYRILNVTRIPEFNDYHRYFSDVYDHLLRLSEILEVSRELTADIRDSYISLNAFHGNQIVMKLTLLSAIFLPLTFIAGIYGMNFEYMPELTWKHGYFAVLAFMLGIGIALPLWFKRKGWFGDKL